MKLKAVCPEFVLGMDFLESIKWEWTVQRRDSSAEQDSGDLDRINIILQDSQD